MSSIPAGLRHTMHSASGSASPLDACATTAHLPGSRSKTTAGCSGVASASTRDGVFPTATGKAVLHSVPCLPFVEQPDADYDLILNTGRTVEHWHTRTKTAQVAMLDAMVPNAWLEMNPADAARLQLKPHDRVTVTSRRNSVRNVELRITGIVAPGQVFMPFHFC